IDVMCAGIWPSSKRARHVDFVKPIFYLPFMAYSRIDDKRFDEDISLLNNPDYTMTMTDGETSSIIAHSDFPKAKKVELPQFSEISQNFLNVVNGKADVYLNDLVSFHDFNKKNPGKLRVIPTDQPIRTFGSTIVVDDDEQKLRRMLQNATEELISKGTIETILQKYEEYPNTFYRVSKPYEEPK
ncbi:MAG: transporter substrate-binding domain-containing protein, partial [Alphaproteobacteria bacterium]|nr:transporter substrate-binding domain-containing protein [Alphaproteobacteria bacterium]